MSRLFPFWLLFILLLAACRGGTSLQPTPTQRPEVFLRFAGPPNRAALYAADMERFRDMMGNVVVDFVSLQRSIQDDRLDFHDAASLADVVLFAGPPPPETASYFIDLAFHMDDAGLTAADFWPGALDGCSVGGRQVGLPLFNVPRVIYFDAAAVEEAAVPLPAPGWTSAEFASTLTALADVVPYPFVQRGAPSTLLGPTVSPLLPSGGGEVDSDALAEVTEWYLDLVEAGHIVRMEDAEAEQAIAAGDAALWIGEPLDLIRYRGALGEEIAIAPFPLPAGESDAPAVPVTITCAGVSTGSARPDIAWQWIQYLSDNPLLTRRWEAPARPSHAGYWEHVEETVEPTYRFALNHGWYGASEAALAAVDSALTAKLDGASGEMIVAVPTPLPTPTAAAVVVQPTPMPVDDEALHLFVGYGNHGHFSELVSAFTERSGVPVELSTYLEWDENGDYFDHFVASYDCFLQSEEFMDIAAGRVFTLTESLAGDPLLDDLSSFALERFRTDEALLGLPLTVRPLVFFYHQQRFQRRDVPPPTADWTFDEFIALAEQFPLGDGTARIYGFVPTPTFRMEHNIDSPMMLLLRGHGVTAYDLAVEPPLLQLDAPETVEGVNWLVDLIEAGVIPPHNGGGSRSGPNEGNDINQIISRGGATIWSTFAGMEDEVFGWGGRRYPMGIVPAPRGVALSPPIVDGFYIGRQGARADSCLDLYRFVSSQPSFYNTSVPPRHSVQQDPRWIEAVGEERAAAYNTALEQPTIAPPVGEYMAPIRDWWEDALEAAFSGADVAAVLADAQEKAEAYIACLPPRPDRYELYAPCAAQADPDYPVFLPEE